MKHPVVIKALRRIHYSPLRYPGGKAILFPYLRKRIAESGLHDITYVEPFAGGAGAALALLLTESVDRIVINDLDKSVYAFWHSALHHSERFVAAIHDTPLTVTEWRKQKVIYSNKRSKRFDLGFAMFYLNRTNVSGILNGGPIGGLDQRGKWKIDARFNRDNLARRILDLAEYRDRIDVTCEDGVVLAGRYLRRANSFLYLDPPYYEKASDLYLSHYAHRDHVRLAKKLNANASSPWLLTYDDHPVIADLYAERRVVRFSLSYNAYERRRGRELMIQSDRLAT